MESGLKLRSLDLTYWTWRYSVRAVVSAMLISQAGIKLSILLYSTDEQYS